MCFCPADDDISHNVGMGECMCKCVPLNIVHMVFIVSVNVSVCVHVCLHVHA